jgi:hypothetical protein
MGYTLRGVGAMSVSGTGDITPALPSGWLNGDLGLAIAASRSVETITTPSGWTLLAAGSSGVPALYGRIMQGGDVAPTFVFSGTTRHVAQVASFSGDVYTDLATIVAHSTPRTEGSGADFPYDALSITTDNCLVLIVGQKTKTNATNGATINDEAGFTELGESGEDGTRFFLVWNYVQQTTATNIAAGAWDFTGATESLTRRGFTVALKSLDGGGGGGGGAVGGVRSLLNPGLN